MTIHKAALDLVEQASLIGPDLAEFLLGNLSRAQQAQGADFQAKLDATRNAWRLLMEKVKIFSASVDQVRKEAATKSLDGEEREDLDRAIGALDELIRKIRQVHDQFEDRKWHNHREFAQKMQNAVARIHDILIQKYYDLLVVRADYDPETKEIVVVLETPEDVRKFFSSFDAQ